MVIYVYVCLYIGIAGAGRLYTTHSCDNPHNPHNPNSPDNPHNPDNPDNPILQGGRGLWRVQLRRAIQCDDEARALVKYKGKYMYILIYNT